MCLRHFLGMLAICQLLVVAAIHNDPCETGLFDFRVTDDFIVCDSQHESVLHWIVGVSLFISVVIIFVFRYRSYREYGVFFPNPEKDKDKVSVRKQNLELGKILLGG